MNFHELKIVVSQIKREMPCLKCKENYRDIDIDLIGSPNEDEAFFCAFCPNCEMEAVIHVNMDHEPCSHCSPGDPSVRLGTAPRMEYISSNEVLDMHNFLKNFDGSFDNIFKEKNQNS